MQPVWEQSISFKKALAIAAVQKRRFDEEIKHQESKSARLEQEIEQLKLKLDKYKAEASPELLLSTCFHLGTSASAPEHEEQSSVAADFSLQLETLAISATLWTRAAEILPPTIHGFLCQVLDYTAKRRIEPTPEAAAEHKTNTVSCSLSCSPLIAGTLTPVQALIQLTHDIISTPAPSSTSPNFSPKSIEQILVNAASCLGQLCKHPQECLTLQDFSLLQEFTSQVLAKACCSNSNLGNLGNVDPEDNTEKKQEKNYQNKNESNNNVGCLLEAFQSNCGTGYLVLGCAAHGLQNSMQRLKGIVTGEIELSQQQQQPLQLPTPSPSTLNNEIIFPEQQNEESLITSCGAISRILQTCLRELPSWSVELPFQDEFLREIAAAVWDVSASSKVIAPAHQHVAKHGQRCAALLMSALQQMSSSVSRDECPTTVDTTYTTMNNE